MIYDWNFAALAFATPAFARGLLCTVELSVLASVIGTAAGAALAFGLRSKRSLHQSIEAVLGAVRAVPILVLLFFFYYFPYSELGLGAPSAFCAAVLALSLAQCAHSLLIVSSAITHVPYEQKLGLRGLGFSEQQIARHAVLPWVLRETLPGHMTLWIGNVLQSSLASTIGVEETVYVAKLLAAQTFRSLEAWIVVAGMYLLIVLPLSSAQKRLEIRYERYRRAT